MGAADDCVHRHHRLHVALARECGDLGDHSLVHPEIAGFGKPSAQIDGIRERKEKERLAAERKKQEAEEARARRARLNAIIQRGDAVWREIETEIERRNASGYDKATSLLADLKTIAEQNGGTADFIRRLHSIRERHAQKGRFIERLNVFG
ncbi:hypothetical protein MK632_12245 [Rhizobium changzhiense]|uniref:hypothetical protein n=1 Tax=Rhizobium changzhiense TaxID=2692317 RepID=UPI001F0CB140|nr:hypothetical protein [Rhizobium changzhiense]MCH4546544.1 hypothetical protein [Rhizobium changzhiense]